MAPMYTGIRSSRHHESVFHCVGIDGVGAVGVFFLTRALTCVAGTRLVVPSAPGGDVPVTAPTPREGSPG